MWKIEKIGQKKKEKKGLVYTAMLCQSNTLDSQRGDKRNTLKE
jgi:hypothetical protein